MKIRVKNEKKAIIISFIFLFAVIYGYWYFIVSPILNALKFSNQSLTFVSTNEEPLNPMVFINPKIIKKSGACISHEGCLSFPEAFTDVRRYANVMVKAMDRNGRSFVLEAKDGTLLARCIQHEFDHLNGILFIDHLINRFDAETELSKHDLPPIEVDKLLDEPELQAEVEKLLEAKVEKKE